MIPGNVTMCVCAKMTFRRWLELRNEHGWSDTEAAASTGCGEGCGTCKPYLDVVKATGRTCLPVMGAEEFEQAISGC